MFIFTWRSLFREATGIVEGQQEVAKGTKRAAALDKAKAEDESTKLRKVGVDGIHFIFLFSGVLSYVR